LKNNLYRASGMLAAVILTTVLAVAGEDGRSVFVLTSTNNASADANAVVVFKLNTGGSPSLSWVAPAARAVMLEFYSSRTISEL